VSVLSFPRINFRGVFRTNPCTSNNDDVMPRVVDRDTDTLGSTLAGMSDNQIEAYLREQVAMSNNPPSPQNPNPTCLAFIRAGWNLYGDFTTALEDTVVTSVVYGPDPKDHVTSATQDSLIGRPVQLLGSVTNDPARRGTAMLCDLDPTGLVTTQMWVGGLQIGDIVIDHDTRAFQNWLNFNSTVGGYNGEQNFVGIGCTWQFAIPAPALPAPDASMSASLQALMQAATKAAGLVVRFRTFEVQPELRDERMAAVFKQGQAIDNPAVGYVVGTIGFAEIGEPETETAGRKLTVSYPRLQMSWTGPGTAAGSIPAAAAPWGAPPALIGNAVACVHESMNVVSLDLVGTFPKYGFRDPDGPGTPSARGFGAPKQMANVGKVVLGVIPAGASQPDFLTPIDYGLTDYSSYEDFGGIVDLKIDPGKASEIATGTLVVQSVAPPNKNVTLLQEATLRVVTDDRTMYLLPGAVNQAFRIKVYDRGGATKAATQLYLYEYRNFVQPQSGPTCKDGVRPNQTVVQPDSSDNQPILNLPPSPIVVPAGQGFSDWFTFTFSTKAAGATILSVQTANVEFGINGVVGVPTWTTATYSAIRSFPDEDFSALYVNGVLNWNDVYQQALRYYYVLFPAMSRLIPLNYPDFLVKQADIVKQRLSTPKDQGFWTTYNMPPTRTMSPAKVKLILDFITQQVARQTT